MERARSQRKGTASVVRGLGRCQNDHRDASRALSFSEPFQDSEAVDVRHKEIEDDEIREGR